MHELLAFFVKHSKWFLFIVYAGLSLMLLFKSGPYQHHVYLTSANAVTSAVYKASNSVYSYFHLREMNDDLNQRNAELQSEAIALRQQLTDLREAQLGDTLQLPDSLRQYRFIVAHVISNSIAQPYNYITINKGSAEGIRPEMGVVDPNGVVGIVNVVGEHSARVISLLNPNLRLSCRLKGSSSFGSLVWEGSDPEIALLQELPRHTVFQPGDTVVTSGYSGVFPEGIPVGIVMADNEHKNENFFTLKVKLSTDFATLSNVQVVIDSKKDEREALEAADYTVKTK
ncbi:MAG: rod shape-determining protein MreC [Bacteroidales bacterium]|nr:rod shape-determining protein MreC [Bacteroidales bacterium]